MKMNYSYIVKLIHVIILSVISEATFNLIFGRHSIRVFSFVLFLKRNVSQSSGSCLVVYVQMFLGDRLMKQHYLSQVFVHIYFYRYILEPSVGLYICKIKLLPL